MPTAKSMTSGEALVQSLLHQGVDTVFGLPGVQTYALFDALLQHKNELRYVGSRHEQGAAYMAFGYAKSTGRVGVYTVVPGPGFLNTTAALCTAYAANSPVLCITGQIPSNAIGKGGGELHELPDQLGVIRLLTKWGARVNAPGEAPGVMDEAFRQMLSGRQRPVAIEVPWDVLQRTGDVSFSGPGGLGRPGAATLLPRPPLDPQAIEEAARLIREARQPMIMLGSGALDAGAEVLELAGRIQAPVVSFRSGRGIVSEDSPYGFNCAAGYKWWAKTDLLIGIGSRLELQALRWRTRLPNLIRIDIDAAELARLPANASVLADAREAVTALNSSLRRSGFNPRSRAADLTSTREQSAREVQDVQPQLSYLEAIRDVLPRDGFFVEEVSQ